MYMNCSLSQWQLVTFKVYKPSHKPQPECWVGVVSAAQPQVVDDEQQRTKHMCTLSNRRRKMLGAHQRCIVFIRTPSSLTSSLCAPVIACWGSSAPRNADQYWFIPLFAVCLFDYCPYHSKWAMLDAARPIKTVSPLASLNHFFRPSLLSYFVA